MNEKLWVEMVDIELPFDAKLAFSVMHHWLAVVCYSDTEEMHVEICLS